MTGTTALRVLLKAVLLAVVVAFVAWTGRDLALRWRDSGEVVVSWGWLAASVVPIVVVALCQGFAWVSLVAHLARREVALRPGLELLFASMLGRYVPAKVGMAAVLVVSAKRLALPASLLVSAMVIQALVYTLLGMGMGVAAVGLSHGALPAAVAPLGSGLGAVAIAGLVAIVIALTVVDRSRYPAFVHARLQVQGAGPLINLAHVGWLVIVWLAWWAHGLLVVVAVGGSWSAGVDLAGFFVLAPVIGFVALVSPGGLGVREAVVAAGLSPIVGPAPATIAAVIARVVSLGVDILMWAIFRVGRPRDEADPEHQ